MDTSRIQRLAVDDWGNAGGDTTIVGQAGLVTYGRLGRVSLSRPTMVAVQLAETLLIGNAALETDARIFARVDWQVGRGNHRVYVDVVRGSTFTIGAAEAVEITGCWYPGASTNGTGDVIGIECTMAPASAINPIPATWTMPVNTLIAGVASTTNTRSETIGQLTLPFPRMARRVSVLANVQNAADSMILTFQGGGANVVIDSNARSVPIPITFPFDTLTLTSAVNCNAKVVWELML